MTYEEAIELIRYDDDCNSYCDNCLTECAKKEAVEIAVEYIKKQIPKKPTNICIRCGFVVEGLCSTCGSAVLPEHKYCSNCGQAIDWSEE